MLTSIAFASLVILQPAASEPEAPAVKPCGTAPPGMVCVPGGWFTRGNDDDTHTCQQRFGAKLRAHPNARPAVRAWVQTFYMDTYEVTVEDYEACIESGTCKPRPEDKRWGPRYNDFSRPKQPITGANWYQAMEYCQQRGASLPTGAQWEMAARGPDGEKFPWGNEPVNCERAVIKDPKLGRSCGVKKRGSETTGRPLEVGSRPVGRYGIYDMIGNIEEWVADWYTDDYDDCGADCSGIEPKGPCGGKEPCEGRELKVVRGGSWYWPAPHGTAWHRRPHYPQNPPPRNFHHFGFRCAASLEQGAAIEAEKGAAP